MFLITQFIGLYVINHYSNQNNPLPYGMQAPEITSNNDFYTSFFPSIIFAFIFAIVLLILLTKFNLGFVLKLWFFVVVLIALGIFVTSFFPNQKYISYIALIFVLPLAVLKVYRRNLLIHNTTELVIYPSIAAVFVPLLNFWTIIILLILISIYDMWAVWHSGIMQRMAKYQINQLKIFSGFFVPYISKKLRMRLNKLPKSKLKNKKIKVNVAILGGGDVVFPIITAGVMLVQFGFMHALFVIIGAALGLSYLLFFAEKKKFYPAMPFITAGIFLGIVSSLLFL
ncbi:MAG: presenilin family intramembrane aspartyl protease [Nanoarchaeota archaeon]